MNDLKRRLLAPLSSFNYGIGVIFMLFSMIARGRGSVKTVLTIIGIVFFAIGAFLTALNIWLSKKSDK